MLKANKFPANILMGVLLLVLFATVTVSAREVTQTLTLKPGWNSVFLQVDPSPNACEEVFAGLENLMSVWIWHPRLSTVQYIQDPGALIPDASRYMVYFPGNPVLSNLHAIYGETAYIIHLGGREDVTWTVTGQPCMPEIQWKPNSFNFVGFHLTPGEEPFFGDFFSTSPALAGQDIYILNDGGKWALVANPAVTRMKSGEGFWIYCKGRSEYQGPLSVQTDQSGGLLYGAHLVEQNLRLLNASGEDLDLAINLEGDVPLSWWHLDPETGDSGWHDFPMGVSLAAGNKKTLRIGVTRAGLEPGALYESNLVITNGSGVTVSVPVNVEGISYAGLWVGEAAVSKVNEVRVKPDADFPLEDRTGTEFSFRLILHVDESGQARLCKQVIQMWDETQKKFVLFTEDGLIARYSTGDNTMQRGFRRISSAAFSELSGEDPKYEAPMTGSFDSAEGNLACTIAVRQDDPMNPFRHRYHNDHKDVDKAYEVTRQIELVFSSEDSDGNPLTSVPVLTWGGTDMGGIYRETLTGLHKTPIKVEGVFLLHKVSSVGQLER